MPECALGSDVMAKSRFWTYVLLLSVAFLTTSVDGYAQSNLKEGQNSYALYSRSGDLKQLEAARKFADAAYKTRRDTLSFRNNLLRALVYSTLAVADSNRRFSYPEDPLDIAHAAMRRLNDKQLLFDNEPEIDHITRNLANGHLIKANRALEENQTEEAYIQFKKVDSIDHRTFNVGHNLAVLSDRLEKDQEAIARYKALMANSRTSKPAYIHALADLYAARNDKQGLLEILVRGRERFPHDRDILFRLINGYNQIGAYDAIVPLLEAAFKADPDNVELYYIAGYAYDVTDQVNRAKECYEKAILLDRNSYPGNYGLGLIYLREYLAKPGDQALQGKAENYLLRANQIRPSAVNALKSLSVFYEAKGDVIQLERVNNTLDQLTLN